MDLRDNNLSAKALRSLLGKLDWEVVQLTAARSCVELRNEEDITKISDEIAGYFNIKESRLVLERSPSLAPVACIARLFEAKLTQLTVQEHLFAEQDDLLEILELKMEKISKMLLDCTGEEQINWSLIETYLKKHQVGLLDIAVDGHKSVDDSEERQSTLSLVCHHVNIHAIFYVKREGDFGKIVNACQRKKIEFIRCIIDSGCRASLDEISFLVKKSNLKRVILIYCEDEDMLRKVELKKIANDFSIEVEVLKLNEHEQVKDAWQELDGVVLTRPISDCNKLSEVTEFIGPKGKTIEIDGCSIAFPPGCFDQAQLVTIKAYIDHETWPPGRVGITPTLHVEAPDLKVPAIVKLPTWCASDANEEGPMVEVLRFNRDNNNWERVYRSLLGVSRNIEFEINHFSDVGVTAKSSDDITCILSPAAYFSRHIFAVTTTLNNETAKKKCREKLEHRFSERVTATMANEKDKNKYRKNIKKRFESEVTTIECDNFECKTSQSFRSKISCVTFPDTFKFNPVERDQSVQKVNTADGSCVNFAILESNETSKKVVMKFEILQDDKSEHEVFDYCWKPQKTSSTEQQIDTPAVENSRASSSSTIVDDGLQNGNTGTRKRKRSSSSSQSDYPMSKLNRSQANLEPRITNNNYTYNDYRESQIGMVNEDGTVNNENTNCTTNISAENAKKSKTECL